MAGNAHGQFYGTETGDLQILCPEETSCGQKHFLHVMFTRNYSRSHTSISYSF